MFSRSAISVQKTFIRGVRFNSTASKATNAAQGFVEKITANVNKAVYWSKVTGELAKQVYLKEKLSPPSIADFQTVYTTLYKQVLQLSTKPKEVLSFAKNFGKNEALNYGSLAIQLLGLFSLGEIIGRRQIVGYPQFGSQTHH
ncbi:ATP synthase subunit g, mitochondrial [Wickerhamomyces ciferrii]|uniref:ATP synthase subunit g, mitochondrial n=1 Tax=Wickerhamomyces ciferrii (strain ATCC 14091 / BCRC 22168 / CBS 111 / JCM 3599 / NBRC 0793 / NRRL Y-1031 F-60-10) TaxID=1206466 RepID=K0KHN5_WICCF|nr:ATP synthase subunit g, mitochondrial [Wickerhamomyces ciferrii]CCH40884.1 ATP synthase subunit g, mitochondrial [Wickerhamomyces ciferrii]